jgi:hypothetical protein
MNRSAKLEIDGAVYTLPIIEDTEREAGIDISTLRSTTGHITLDDGYANTGSCVSRITFIDGEKGILRYRGIDIEELAKESNFIETAKDKASGKRLMGFGHRVYKNYGQRDGRRSQGPHLPPAAALHGARPKSLCSDGTAGQKGGSG